MNNIEKHREDPLRNYITPEIIEKAPEGFTSRVMTAVHKEPVPVRKRTLFSRSNIVPAVSASVVMVLILLAFLLPGTKNDTLLSPALDIFKKISVSIPEYDIRSFLNFEIPPTLIYVFIGILILSLLDRALNIVFHREK
jgi:hypothetical protein